MDETIEAGNGRTAEELINTIDVTAPHEYVERRVPITSKGNRVVMKGIQYDGENGVLTLGPFYPGNAGDFTRLAACAGCAFHLDFPEDFLEQVATHKGTSFTVGVE